MKYVSNEMISKWLSEGKSVRSIAMGRIGKVLEISSQGDVVIFSAKRGIGKCVTTFEAGDQVVALENGDEVVIANASFEKHKGVK